MDDKTLPTLDEIYKLTKDNNRMLHAMRRQAFVKSILGFVWWVFFFLVLPYLTYLYVKPYLDQIGTLYQQVQGEATQAHAAVQGLPDFSKLLQQFTGGAK